MSKDVVWICDNCGKEVRGSGCPDGWRVMSGTLTINHEHNANTYWCNEFCSIDCVMTHMKNQIEEATE